LRIAQGFNFFSSCVRPEFFTMASDSVTLLPSITNGEPESDWRATVLNKQQQCQEAIPAAWRVGDEFCKLFTSPQGVKLIEGEVVRRSGLLSEHELDITENYSAAKLLKKLATAEFSSLDVTTAFCKRAAIAQQLVS
jgi:amidase